MKMKMLGTCLTELLTTQPLNLATSELNGTHAAGNSSANLFFNTIFSPQFLQVKSKNFSC